MTKITRKYLTTLVLNKTLLSNLRLNEKIKIKSRVHFNLYDIENMTFPN